MSGREPYDIVRCPPGRRCKRSAGHRMVPGRFYTDKTNFHVQLWYTLISKFAISPPKKQVVNTRKTEADSDSDGGENHTCSRLHFRKSVFGANDD